MTDFKELREALEAGPTDGPWRVFAMEYPHHLGGKHVERRIFTEWVHPQLKGEYPVVNGSVGIGEVLGGPSRHMVHLEEADAAFIAAANPATIRSLLAELDEARRDAERWRTFIGMGYEIRAEWAANLSLAPVLTSWVDAAMKEQQP